MGQGLIRTRLPHDNCLLFRPNLKKPKNRRGGWGLCGSPILFLGWNPNIFVSLEPMQKFENLRQPFLGF